MKMLYVMFVSPFVRLFTWFMMKYVWRGFAIIAKQDWKKVGDKNKFLREFKNDQSVKDAQAALTKVLWPESYRPCLHESKEDGMSLEEIQEVIKGMLRKHNISYEDFIAYMNQEGGTGFSFKIRRSGDGGNS